MVETIKTKDKIKIAILGAGGFLGTKLTAALSKKYEVVPYFHEGRQGLDITDKDAVSLEFAKINPNIVINATGMTNVDLCEKEKEKAYQINVKGTENIAKACGKLGIKLVHFSTDFVFDNVGGDYKEGDKTNPPNQYAMTKLQSEKAVVENCKDYLILRVAILYGYNGNKSERSFVDWVHKSLKQGKQINVFKDMYGTPTLIDDIAKAVDRLIGIDAHGLYHVAGSQKLSRYEMAVKIADAFGFDRKLIKPVKTEDMKFPAKRTLDSSLSIEKIKKLGIRMHTFDEGIKMMKGMMKK